MPSVVLRLLMLRLLMCAVSARAVSSTEHLHTQVTCNEASSEVLVFVHGWPDDAQVWLPLVNGSKTAPLFSHFRCILVYLPIADRNTDWDTEQLDFPKLISLVADVVRNEVAQKSPVTLVGHDWGAILAMGVARQHPELLKRLALFDVGVQPPPLNMYLPLVVAYQAANIGLYLLGRLWRQPADFLNGLWRSLLIGRDSDYDRPKGALLNYFYRHVPSFLLGGLDDVQMAAREPKMPLLFLYGMHMYHDALWAESLNHKQGCSSQKAGDDHWFFIDRPVDTAKLLLSWMSDCDRSMGGENAPSGQHDNIQTSRGEL